MTIQIRPYKPSDRDFILSLVTRFSDFELPQWRQRNEIDQTNRHSLEKALNQPEPNSAIFIAEDEGRALAGFIHLQTQADYFNGEKQGYISDLAVDQAFEGRGVGRLLLEAAEDWAHQNGYQRLALYVFAGNTRARQIYEKAGFQQDVLKYVKVIE
jgi:GNAT superfamily N-acetyltransferase